MVTSLHRVDRRRAHYEYWFKLAKNTKNINTIQRVNATENVELCWKDMRHVHFVEYAKNVA